MKVNNIPLYIDYDCTLVSTILPVLKTVNNKYDVDIIPPNITDYSWLEEHISSDISMMWGDPNIYDEIVPYLNAEWFIETLKAKGHPIKIITFSKESVVEAKNKHAFKYFGINEEDMIHCHNDKYAYTTDGILIDDRVKNIRDHVSQNNKPGILFNYLGENGWSFYSRKSIITQDHLYSHSYVDIIQQLEKITNEKI